MLLAWLCFSKRETKCYYNLDLRGRAIKACEAKAQYIAGTALRCDVKAANIGAGTSRRWQWLVKPDNAITVGYDFNTDELQGEFDLVICEQVVEHLHNTTHFLAQLAKITKSGGKLLISTENLASWPNKLMLLLGLAPFSTQPVCGAYVGGWKKGIHSPDCALPEGHPAFSGQRGHVRVLTRGQMKTLLERAGFYIKKVHTYGFGHYILFHCIKKSMDFACVHCATREELHHLIYRAPDGQLVCKHCKKEFRAQRA